MVMFKLILLSLKKIKGKKIKVKQRWTDFYPQYDGIHISLLLICHTWKFQTLTMKQRTHGSKEKSWLQLRVWSTEGLCVCFPAPTWTQSRTWVPYRGSVFLPTEPPVQPLVCLWSFWYYFFPSNIFTLELKKPAAGKSQWIETTKALTQICFI